MITNIASKILIPLLAGYIFAVLFPPSGYNAAREEGQKLYFRAMFYGLFIFVSTLLINIIVIKEFPGLVTQTKLFITYVLEQSFQAQSTQHNIQIIFLGLISVIYAIFLGLASNVSSRFKLYAFHKAIVNDDIEIIITRAVLRGLPISVTMNSGKVYVGFVGRTTDPKESRKDIKILPLLSGYRDKDTHSINFTTNYYSIYESNDNSLSHLKPEDFEIAFPLSELSSINLFDIDAYNKFNPVIKG
jgi:hypothetical protein